jgi:hypothetical protein
MHGFRLAMLLGVAWLVPAPARAQGEVDLAWTAPAECPQRDAVRQRIRALADPALRDAGQIRAEGRIVRIDARYRLTLSVRDQGELRERTIDAESCVDLGGAAAVALGLLVRKSPEQPGVSTSPGTSGDATAKGPGEGTTGSAPSSDKNSGAATQKPPPVVPATASPSGKTPEKPGAESEKDPEEPESPNTGDVPSPYEDVSRPSGRIEPILRAPVIAWDFVRLPKPSFGLGGGLGIRYGAWRFVGSGRFVFNQTWLMPGSADAGAEVSRAVLDVSACFGLRSGRLEFAPCLTAGLDRVSARGTGAGVSPRSQYAISAVLGAAGAAHLYVFESMAILASVGVGVETSTPHLVVEGLGEVGQLRPVLVSVGVGPEWIF